MRPFECAQGDNGATQRAVSHLPPMIKGVVETDGAGVHVIAQELTDCSELLKKTNVNCRDFT